MAIIPAMIRSIAMGSAAATVAGFLAASQLAAAPGPAGGANHLTIVSSLPRTGSANSQTTSIVNGIRMAIEERGGKVDGLEIRYEDLDDASPQKGNWDQNLEAANANKAAKDPACVGYIGTYNSGAAKIAMPILNKAGVVMVSPGNTYPGLTKPGAGEPNEPKIYRPSGKVSYFRVVPTDDIQGAVACEFCVQDLKAKKAFVLHDRELYGKGIADVFEKRAKEIGLAIVEVEGIDPKAANYRSLVTKIKASGADFVYFGGTTQNNAGQIAKDLRSGGVDAPFMVPDGCFEEAFIEAAGAANLNGKTYVTFGGLPADQLTG